MKNQIKDFDKNIQDLKNQIKVSKNKEEFMKGEIKKNHIFSENLQNQLNKVIEDLKKTNQIKSLLNN